ncbi:ran-specific GTPase-activating protein isoform X1 [Strongylocentrotus purpuratus]|uniref:RanBD1 domain-containing protein n=1 Tax=Strongylocentrotus purpuratus TaxID=7668 RepID=A0A7M7TH60_STRPU|nr:ran-specific GTPase-activating protein isoform X1 [Strongylocentrotus purpuratus]|eukprot:XP_792600.2 PREDICTED: ran-specific GTPase-activating protein isoform X1 [Strongylocentrotus purpuratus]
MADQEETSPDIYFEPIVKLKPVDVKNLEEDEEEIFKMRAKLYRYANEESPAEWKERGTGEVKMLKKRDDNNGHVRILMRRDKTFKICANHYIQSHMDLKPNCGSDKAFVWNTLADFADEEPKQETLAIRFGNAENAKKFKEKFEECQKLLTECAAARQLDLLERLGASINLEAEAEAPDNQDEKTDEKPENESKQAEKPESEPKQAEKPESESKQAEKSEKDADEVTDKLGGMTVKDTEKTTDGEEPSKETVKTEGEAKEGEVEKSKEETTKEEGKGGGDSKDAS